MRATCTLVALTGRCPDVCTGQRAVFTVPPDLAYGVEGRPPVIPPSCPLEFEVELIDFFEPGTRAALCAVPIRAVQLLYYRAD